MPVFGPGSAIEPAPHGTGIAVADWSALRGGTMWQFWVDRGGTFTDIVASRPDGGLVSHKLLSENPERYEDAAVQGIRDLLGLASSEEIPGPAVEAVKMGTTVATNALLERKGDRTVLLITKGFGDLLRIGYQNRPKLFDLHIRLPELLYERVEEVPERLNAAGEILIPLCEQSVRKSLQAAYDAGIRSAAIAFMHAYKSSAHERRTAEIASEVGFTQVSVSHEASSLMKLVGRGDTTVVDAYLSPILRRYVARVRSALSGSPNAGTKAPAVHAVERRTDGRRPVPRQGRHPVRPGRRRCRDGEDRRNRGPPQPDRVRHGRHVDRCLPLRRQIRAELRDRGGGRANPRADDEDPYGRGRRRLNSEFPRRKVPSGSRERGRQPGTGVLPAGRPSHGHRLQRVLGKDPAGPLSARVRPRSERAA